MPGLHCRGLFALLENNGCKRVSAKGLVNDNPKSYKLLKELLFEGEHYYVLEALENQRDKIDQENHLFICNDGNPLIFSKKENYNERQCCSICEIAGIRCELIPEYSEVIPV